MNGMVAGGTESPVVRISLAGSEAIPDKFTLFQSRGSRGIAARVKYSAYP